MTDEQRDLLTLRRVAHYYFDILWLYKSHRTYRAGKFPTYWRRKMYKWLSKQTGIPREQCHMSQMNQDQCMLVVDICLEKIRGNPKILDFKKSIQEGRLPAFSWYTPAIQDGDEFRLLTVLKDSE